VVDELTLAEPKTKLMDKALSVLVGDASALVLIPEKNAAYDLIARSTNNIADAKVLLASYLNVRDLVGFDKVVMPLKALDVLVAQLG
jgi:large subunit ribosomal protein L4